MRATYAHMLKHHVMIVCCLTSFWERARFSAFTFSLYSLSAARRPTIELILIQYIAHVTANAAIPQQLIPMNMCEYTKPVACAHDFDEHHLQLSLLAL